METKEYTVDDFITLEVDTMCNGCFFIDMDFSFCVLDDTIVKELDSIHGYCSKGHIYILKSE